MAGQRRRLYEAQTSVSSPIPDVQSQASKKPVLTIGATVSVGPVPKTLGYTSVPLYPPTQCECTSVNLLRPAQPRKESPSLKSQHSGVTPLHGLSTVGPTAV